MRRSSRLSAQKKADFTYRELFASDDEDEEDSTPELMDCSSSSDDDSSDDDDSQEPPKDALDVIDDAIDAANQQDLCDPKVCCNFC